MTIPPVHRPMDPASPALKALDLSGRQRQLRAAMQAMSRVARRFSRDARRTLPFLIRHKARLVPEPVSILGPSDPTPPVAGPQFEVMLEAEEMSAWARLTVNAAALQLILEGSLGARSIGATDLGGDLTLAQRAVVSRVARGLAESFAAAVREEVGLTFAAVAAQTRNEEAPPDVPVAHGLRVDCSFEPSSTGAGISIAVSAEALELAAREQEGEPGAAADPRMAEALLDVEVEVAAELGRTGVGLRDVLGLRVGQVLRLPTATDDPVIVKVANLAKLVGRPVVSRGQISVEIKGRLAQ